MPAPSEEFAHLHYRVRWMLYRNAYKAITVGALVLGVLLVWFTGPQLADKLWPNRYHEGVDRIVRDNGVPPNQEEWQLEAWRASNGRVVTWNSAGIPHGGQVEKWGFAYWIGLPTVLFFAGRQTLLPYRRRLGLDRIDCDYMTIWHDRPESITNRDTMETGT